MIYIDNNIYRVDSDNFSIIYNKLKDEIQFGFKSNKIITKNNLKELNNLIDNLLKIIDK